MKKLLWSATAGAALIWASASPSTAATLTELGTSGSVTYNSGLSDAQDIYGAAEGSTALSYTNDYLEFGVGGPPASPVTTVTVNFLSTQQYPGEMWRVTEGSTTGAVVLTGPANNLPYSTPLSTAYNYYLEFYSSSAPGGNGGNSQFSISVANTPLPGTLALFAGGFGLLGYAGRRKREKKRLLASTSLDPNFAS